MTKSRIQREIAISKVVWGALRRNEEYIQFSKKGTNKLFHDNGSVWNETLSKFRIPDLIPPHKNFGECFRESITGIRVTGEKAWTDYFFSYHSPVYVSITPGTRRHYVSFVVNLAAPYNQIITSFKKLLKREIMWEREVLSKMKVKRPNLRLFNKADIDIEHYELMFSLYDLVSGRKTKAKKIHWKGLHSQLSAKKARDIYKKAKNLVNGGYRLIS